MYANTPPWKPPCAGAYDKFGAIDVLVSGAAGNFPAPALGMSANAFKTVVDIDLLGTFNVLRAAFEFLRKPGASVINISAPQAFQPMELQMHVCAAKAGVDMVTRVGALEWGPAGVRVNSIVPGPIANTEGMKRLAPTPQLAQIVSDSVPLRRFGEASEIADACLWLGSNDGGLCHRRGDPGRRRLVAGRHCSQRRRPEEGVHRDDEGAGWACIRRGAASLIDRAAIQVRALDINRRCCRAATAPAPWRSGS